MKKILLLLLLLPLFAYPQAEKRHRSIIIDSVKALNGGIFDIKDSASFDKPVGIGGILDASALLTLTDTAQGFLVPRMTAVQRNNIISPATGLLVFDTDSNAFFCFVGLWSKLAAGVGVGDMLISAYDNNNDSIVNNADTLNGDIDASQIVGLSVGDSSFVTLQVDTFKAFNNTNIQVVDSTIFQNYVQVDSAFKVGSGGAAFNVLTNGDVTIGFGTVGRVLTIAAGNNLTSGILIGTDSPSQEHIVIKTFGGKPLMRMYGNNGNLDLQLGTDNGLNFIAIDAQAELGIGTNSATAKLHVKGADATSGNFAFKAQDNVGTDLFWIKNDGQVTAGITFNYFTDTSAVDDSYGIIEPLITTYTTGLNLYVNISVVNTGAATLQINALAAITIKKLHDQDLVTGDIEAGQIIHVIYDGTNFQLLSQLAQ